MRGVRKEVRKMGKFKDLTGMKFNKLTVIEQAGHDCYGKILWRCLCECGNETITHGRDLVNGHCKSCGCILKANRRENGRFRGLSDTRPFHIWKGMIARCNNPETESYPDYGGRGITVCDEWTGTQGFFNFLAWALNNGYSDNLSIDRINNNGNYEPSNCRWATWIQQASNRRRPDKIRNQYGEWGYKIPLPEPWRGGQDGTT